MRCKSKWNPTWTPKENQQVNVWPNIDQSGLRRVDDTIGISEKDFEKNKFLNSTILRKKKMTYKVKSHKDVLLG